MRVEATALLGALLTHAMSSPALSFSAPPISRRPILASHRQEDPFDRTITLASRTRRPPRARKLRLVAKNLEDMISENSGIRVGRVVRVEGDAAAVAITCWREVRAQEHFRGSMSIRTSFAGDTNCMAIWKPVIDAPIPGWNRLLLQLRRGQGQGWRLPCLMWGERCPRS